MTKVNYYELKKALDRLMNAMKKRGEEATSNRYDAHIPYQYKANDAEQACASQYRERAAQQGPEIKKQIAEEEGYQYTKKINRR